LNNMETKVMKIMWTIAALADSVIAGPTVAAQVSATGRPAPVGRCLRRQTPSAPGVLEHLRPIGLLETLPEMSLIRDWPTPLPPWSRSNHSWRWRRCLANGRWDRVSATSGIAPLANWHHRRWHP
jgi:hypothetical protein